MSYKNICKKISPLKNVGDSLKKIRKTHVILADRYKKSYVFLREKLGKVLVDKRFICLEKFIKDEAPKNIIEVSENHRTWDCNSLKSITLYRDYINKIAIDVNTGYIIFFDHFYIGYDQSNKFSLDKIIKAKIIPAELPDIKEMPFIKHKRFFSE